MLVEEGPELGAALPLCITQRGASGQIAKCELGHELCLKVGGLVGLDEDAVHLRDARQARQDTERYERIMNWHWSSNKILGTCVQP